MKICLVANRLDQSPSLEAKVAVQAKAQSVAVVDTVRKEVVEEAVLSTAVVQRAVLRDIKAVREDEMILVQTGRGAVAKVEAENLVKKVPDAVHQGARDAQVLVHVHVPDRIVIEKMMKTKATGASSYKWPNLYSELLTPSVYWNRVTMPTFTSQIN